MARAPLIAAEVKQEIIKAYFEDERSIAEIARSVDRPVSTIDGMISDYRRRQYGDRGVCKQCTGGARMSDKTAMER